MKNNNAPTEHNAKKIHFWTCPMNKNKNKFIDMKYTIHKTNKLLEYMYMYGYIVVHSWQRLQAETIRFILPDYTFQVDLFQSIKGQK